MEELATVMKRFVGVCPPVNNDQVTIRSLSSITEESGIGLHVRSVVKCRLAHRFCLKA